jgi:nitroreductase
MEFPVWPVCIPDLVESGPKPANQLVARVKTNPPAPSTIEFMEAKHRTRMVKGSEVRKPDFPVDKIFIDRWSPRAFSGEPVPEQDLMSMFEAARWAPSSFNNQPWRMLYARRGTPYWPVFFDLLTEGNKVWCKNAGALVLFISKTTFDHNGQPARTHAFDTGAAWENFALQGTMMGYVVHGMQGFDYDRARAGLGIPDGFEVQAMVAVGTPGPIEGLPESVQRREFPNTRRPLSQTVCQGRFCF